MYILTFGLGPNGQMNMRFVNFILDPYGSFLSKEGGRGGGREEGREGRAGEEGKVRTPLYIHVL